MILIPFLLVPPCGSSVPAGGPGPAALEVLQRRDPVEHVQTWLERLRKGRETIEARSGDEVRLAIGDLRIVWATDPGREREIATVLLDLVGWCGPAAGLQGAASRVAETRDLALDALRAHPDPEFLRWLSRDVLALPSQPLERRVAALALLSQQRESAALLPLLSCARESEPRIRIPALEALVGWEDESVHALFLDELARSLAGASGSAGWLAQAHFGTVMIAPQSPLLPRLAALVERGLSSSDWREVSRAVALGRPLSQEAIVPFLIEALARWRTREEAGAQALRVEMEILRDLETRSGRKLGPWPQGWSTWWRAVRRGDVKGQNPQTGGFLESTRASFFGLRPATDRVTFVIDRSGSMATPLGPETGRRRRTRWEEAVQQLLGFVDAIGPRARFSVVLFHDYPEEWRPLLVDASAENMKSARAWLGATRPGGGTELQGAIARAMRLGPDGTTDLALLEADTVIVLCDGATAEGPDWVERFLKTVNLRARVVFHCVQIGAGGDGTLEKLASGSGGDFVRVDG
jgi:hypothetical protein